MKETEIETEREREKDQYKLKKEKEELRNKESVREIASEALMKDRD